MNIIIIIAIIFAVPFILLRMSKMNKIKEAEKRGRNEKKHEADEEVRRPERKLHEEEKKRWEDEYWKRQKQS